MTGVQTCALPIWARRGPSRRQLDDMVNLAHIRMHFAASRGTYGSPRIHADLCAAGLSIGRHRTARLMRQNGLKAKEKRRFRKTTDSHHNHPIAANLLDQDFATDAPDQKWGVDITYIWTTEGWLYLAIVLDLFSRRIVGWAVSERLKRDLALTALRRAIALRDPAPGDRKSTRLNSSHKPSSYAVFCLKKKNSKTTNGKRNFTFTHARPLLSTAPTL